MNGRSLITLAVSLLFGGLALAEDPAKPAKLDLKELHVYSYCGTEGTHLFSSKEKKLFDELKYAGASAPQTKFRISGKKKQDHYPYGGDFIYHLGKVVLTPLAQRSGTIVVDIDNEKDKDAAPTYYLVFELNNGSLQSQTISLNKGHVYTWTMERGADSAILIVKEGDKVASSINAPPQDVREFGFATTVRFVGNPVDMTVTFD